MRDFDRDFNRKSSEFDRAFKRTNKAISLITGVALLLAVALTGVVIWAIYRLVIHFT